ncbi:MAG TPA: SpoIIE family protein phosphatase, partial [Gaiellales bacterium]|nr:SpoIIE family protein phosphatase [Gaiellales bacterium]
ARSVEGSGIGLALVRELVESLGGRIALDSRVGEGTAVHVTVPARPLRGVPAAPAPARETAEARVAEARGWVDAAAAAGSTPRTDGAPRRSVLVVDDNSDMRAYLVRLLEERYDVRAAPNGAAALELLRSQRPDLVLSDVMMPEVDGYELLRRIRSDPSLADLPVVLLSARAGPESAVEGLELGADDYLVKPFTAEDMLGRVAARLAGGAERRQRQAIAHLGRRLGQAAGVDELVRAVHQCAEEAFGASNAAVGLVEDGGDMLRFWYAVPPAGGVAARYHRIPVDAPTPSATAAREGAVIVLENRGDAAAYGRVADDWQLADVQAQVAVPLVRATGDMAGVLALTWRGPREVPPQEVEQLEEIASMALEALERLRAARLEHRILERLQEGLLEVDMRAPAATVAVRYQPADSALLLGGDWYDVISLPDGRLGISVGDIVGHGLPAATVMGQLRSALGVAATTTTEPSEAVDLVDAYAGRLPAATGATLIYLVLDPGGALMWCSAGHVPPFVHDGSAPRFLTGPQRPPLTAAWAGSPGTERTALPPASLVLVYTDGLVERRGEPLDAGLERLERLACANAHLPVGQLCDAVIDGMRPDDGFDDDIALVALRTPGSTSDRFVDVFHADVAQVPHARQRLRAWLTDVGIAGEAIDDTLLATGEAVANAVEHGSGGDGRRIVSTEASLDAGTLRVAVGDTGRWDTDTSTGPARGRGRGFQVMNALMERVEVHRGWVGTTVAMERTLDRRGEAATRGR